MKRRAAIFFLWLLAGLPARAHDPGLSTAQGRVLEDTITMIVGFSPADAQLLLPAEVRPKRGWSPAEFAAALKPLNGLAGTLWEVRVGDAIIAPREATAEWVTGDNLSFHLVYPRPAGGGRIFFRARQFERLPLGHREFVTFEDQLGGLLARKLLSGKSDSIEFDPPRAVANAAPQATQAPPTFGEFLKLGVVHIWTGYDHLLFLFALLLVCRSFRSIVTIVSCFTLAHSITLAVATLGWIDLPGRFVEPAIAASIVFVGVENLFRRGAEPRGRWAVTFGFGLIHGLGFASVLRDLGVGRGGQGLAVPLVSFNLGVEVGQVVIAAIVLPTVWRLRKNDAFALRGVPILSGLVAALGAWWWLERVWL